MKLSWRSICVIALSIFTLTPCLSHADAPTGAKPVKVAVVNPPKNETSWETGNIEVTYADGHKEVLTKGQRCARPHLSSKGDVGWSVWNDFVPANHAEHTGETLRVRRLNGSTKDFEPNCLFVMDWNFVDDGTALVIASMGYHGHQFYIKYDIATGKVLGQIDEYKPYADLPKWAQPFSDDKP